MCQALCEIGGGVRHLRPPLPAESGRQREELSLGAGWEGYYKKAQNSAEILNYLMWV